MSGEAERALAEAKVSVPWRGYVVSVKTLKGKRLSQHFRPLAGICGVKKSNVEKSSQYAVTVPLRGYVVSAVLHKNTHGACTFFCKMESTDIVYPIFRSDARLFRAGWFAFSGANRKLRPSKRPCAGAPSHACCAALRTCAPLCTDARGALSQRAAQNDLQEKFFCCIIKNK